MNDMYLFIVFAASAYVLQAVISWKQLKHFNQTYSELRRKGKVAIGKRPGKIRSGTIVMLAIDDHDQVLEVRKMQGVTSLAKFHSLPVYAGEDINYIDRYHPSVRAEDRLTQAALENAREVYLRIEAGNEKSEQPTLPFIAMLNNFRIWKSKIKEKRSDKRWIS